MGATSHWTASQRSGTIHHAHCLFLTFCVCSGTKTRSHREPNLVHSIQNEGEYCEEQLSTKADNELYQTRTSEILIPESLPAEICIIFPFKPNDLVFGQGTKGDCVNECCVFRPPSQNIPDPPPSPTWFETITDCSDSSASVTKPILLQGTNGESRKICELEKDSSSYKLIEGKSLACASGCCIFSVLKEDQN